VDPPNNARVRGDELAAPHRARDVLSKRLESCALRTISDSASAVIKGGRGSQSGAPLDPLSPEGIVGTHHPAVEEEYPTPRPHAVRATRTAFLATRISFETREISEPCRNS
jgi:hypothetical protein